MANGPKIDCRVKLDLSALNTNLPEEKCYWILPRSEGRGEIWTCQEQGVTEKHQTGKTRRQSSPLVSSPTEDKVSWLWLMDNNKEALPMHDPSVSYVLSFWCALRSHKISNAVMSL